MDTPISTHPRLAMTLDDAGFSLSEVLEDAAYAASLPQASQKRLVAMVEEMLESIDDFEIT